MEFHFFFNGSQLSTTTTTNNLGTFQTALTIPSGIPSGAQTIRAQTDAINFATATYTVTAPSLTASPTSGTPGTRVTLTGTNFDPSSSVTIKWNGTVIAPAETDLKTNNAGSFLANITIPSTYVSGNGQIEVSTSSTNTVVTTFTIAAPTLTLSPSSGLPGAKVSVTGANFEGNVDVSLTWDDTPIATTPITVTTTPLGSFVTLIKVPQNASRTTHYVSATAGGKKINFSASFTITSPAATLSLTTAQPSTKYLFLVPGLRQIRIYWWCGTIQLSCRQILSAPLPMQPDFFKRQRPFPAKPQPAHTC